jgi:integrase
VLRQGERQLRGSTFKRCGCRNPETGKKYPVGKCPRLSSSKRADRDHGSWWGRYDVPRGSSNKRRQPIIGPYKTQKEAEEAIAAELAAVGSTGHVEDKTIKVGEYLTTWLKGKRRLKASTFNSYQEAVELYFRPGIGYLRMCDLRDHHISDLVTAMQQINRPLPAQRKPSEMLLRLIEVRADDERRSLPLGERRHKKSTRPLSPSRIKRVMAVLNSALNTAVAKDVLSKNPAAHVELPRVTRRRPLVWTRERVERWEQTGKVPGKVMVWTPVQCGAFLDFAEARQERLYEMYHLVATRGLRRSETIGLPWADTDLDESKTISVILEEDEDGDEVDGHQDDGTKTEHSTRTIPLDETNNDLLKSWRARQNAERLQAGTRWVDSGRVFTSRDGSALSPQYISRRFEELRSQYNKIRHSAKAQSDTARLARWHRVPEEAILVALNGPPLPPIRFHDLRHCAATYSLAAGVDKKVVSETLGHSRYQFTEDTYTSVIPELLQAAAEAVISIVPRRNDGTTGATKAARKPGKTGQTKVSTAPSPRRRQAQ